MPVPILVSDTYQYANGDANASRVAYVETPALSWSISAALLTCSTNPAFLAAQVFCGPDVRVIAYEFNTAGVWGLFARGSGTYTGTPTYYKAWLSGTTLKLDSVVSGTLTNLVTTTVAARASGAGLIIDCVGGVIQVWYNGVMYISTADSSIAGANAGQSAGVWNGSTTAVQISRFDVRGDDVFPWGQGQFIDAPNEFQKTREWHNQKVEYRSGFVQRNRYWSRGRNKAVIGQKYLSDSDYYLIEAFYDQHYGGLRAFLIEEPQWRFSGFTGLSHEYFATADGVKTLYKVNVDKAVSITTYTDSNTPDSVQPIKSLMTGIVQYATPPYAGAKLYYDAGAPCYYRCYFDEDTQPFDRKVPNYWTMTTKVTQDKAVVEGSSTVRE